MEGILTRNEMENRRLQAAQDLQRGLSQSQVARKFGVSRTTASRWCRALTGNGVEGLRKRRSPGRPSRLKPDQLQGSIKQLGTVKSAVEPGRMAGPGVSPR